MRNIPSHQFAQIPVTLLSNPDIGFFAKTLYAWLHGRHCNNYRTGTGRPVSQPQLASELGVYIRTVQRGLTALERTGWLRRERRYDDRGNLLPCAYHLRSAFSLVSPVTDLPLTEIYPLPIVPLPTSRAPSHARQRWQRHEGMTTNPCPHHPRCTGPGSWKACTTRLLEEGRQERASIAQERQSAAL